MKLLVCLLLLFSVIGGQYALASEVRCAAVYQKIMDEIETGKKVIGSSCLEADHYERMLNWIGTGEKECADMPKQREEMKQFKETFTEFMWQAVAKCGR